LMGKPQGKRPLGRPRREWEYNIKVAVREIGYGVMDWIVLAQDRDQWRSLVNTRLAASQEGLSSVVLVSFGLCSVSHHRTGTSTPRPEFEFLVEDRASTGTDCFKLTIIFFLHIESHLKVQSL
jgi:hypothetical protein